MKLEYYFAASLLLVVFVRAEAQSVVAEHEIELKGVIVDWQDARIINIPITIEGKNFRRSTVSNDNGEFTIELPVGTYRLTVKHRVFKTYVIKKLKVSEATNSVLKIRLMVKPSLTSGIKCPKGELCL